MGGRKAEDKTAMAAQAAGTQFTCFTSTKVQIRTLWRAAGGLVLNLLALLVQTYKY